MVYLSSELVVAAMVAAAVSLVVGVLTFIAAVRSVRNQREIQEREHNRRLTERLYDLRLECYPRAFEITDRLRGEYVYTESLTEDLPRAVLDELLEWHRSQAGFLLSTDSIKAFYRIRGALRQAPIDGGTYSESQRDLIWRAKNNLRSKLRADLNLLYVEEEAPQQDV